MKFKNWHLLLFLFLGLLIICNEEYLKKEMEVNQMKYFKITIASGGGFTGLYKGYTLNSNGNIKHWQRFGTRQDSILWTTNGSIDKIYKFKEELENLGLFNKHYQKTGNITIMVILELQDTTYIWSWPGTDINNSMPDLLKDWYSSVQNYCKSLKK